MRYFEAAVRCHSQISSSAKNESLAQRYSVVLEELRIEALTDRQEQRRNYGPQLNQPSVSSHQNRIIIPSGIRGLVNGSIATAGSVDGADGGYVESSPSVTMDPLTSWGEFDSLVSQYMKLNWEILISVQVTGGVGGLDFLFTGEQADQWDFGVLNNSGY